MSNICSIMFFLLEEMKQNINFVEERENKMNHN